MMSTDTQLEIEENDVFHFQFTESYKEKYGNYHLYHCIERLVVAKKLDTGGFLLCDTFWGIGDVSGKTFKESQIGKDIKIQYYCNLNELEESRDAEKYYDDADVFHLSRQHGCAESCRYTYIKKGARRSKEKMIQTVNEKIQTAESKIRDLQSQIEWSQKQIDEINSGDIEKIWI